jgi:hypothetical protein
MKSELIYFPSGFKDRLNKLRTHRKDAYWEIIARYLPKEEPSSSETQNTPIDNLTETEKEEFGLSPVTSTTNTSC